MGANFIGEAVKRREDYRFLTGAGTYTDDVKLDHQTHAAFVRSPHAHAKIRRIDASKARQAPGVVAVYATGDDIAGAKVARAAVRLADHRRQWPAHERAASSGAGAG